MIGELARLVHPGGQFHRLMALLGGYFDESGTHRPSNVTLLSGFVGPADTWGALAGPWREVLGGRVFHYYDCLHGEGEFEGMPEPERFAIRLTLAGLLANNTDLEGVTAAFKGDYATMIAQYHESWGRAYPNAYTLCFHMCCDQVEKFSTERWGGDPVALVFAETNEYESLAYTTFHSVKADGSYPLAKSLTFASPRDLIQLQAADMLAYETYQYLVSGVVDSYRDWPLLRLVIQKMNGRLMGGMHSPETLAEVFRLNPTRPLPEQS